MFTALMSLALVALVVLSKVNFSHAMDAMVAERKASRADAPKT